MDKVLQAPPPATSPPSLTVNPHVALAVEVQAEGAGPCGILGGLPPQQRTGRHPSPIIHRRFQDSNSITVRTVGQAGRKERGKDMSPYEPDTVVE